MTKLFVFDMDGTLADCSHRLHYVKFLYKETYGAPYTKPPKKSKDYDSFYKACGGDTPIQWAIDLFKIVKRQGETLILTGRSEICRQETNDWLILHEIMYDYICMRPDKNSEQDHILKPRMLEDFLRDKDYQVQFIVDDRNRVVKAFREKGYNVLQCQNGDY